MPDDWRDEWTKSYGRMNVSKLRHIDWHSLPGFFQLLETLTKKRVKRRMVFERVVLEKKTMSQIAREWDVTPSRIRQILRDAIGQLYKPCKRRYRIELLEPDE